jgi:coenzyme F420-dependent glucose-6-phosphate dehydrogenase
VTKFGYALSSEEHSASDLVSNARAAEEAGFSFALISDHFHPWIDRQGESPFVWSVLGGIAEATQQLVVGTGVTCPTIRIHPAIIAQAAATTASMMPGRFFLGLGTGENLNEHILGTAWPEWDVRAEMLEEAVEVIRALWSGEVTSHRGRYYTVQNARIYSLPDTPPPIYLAAGGKKAVRQAARLGDGLIATAPDAELLKDYEKSRGTGPLYGQLTVCWAESEAKARRTAREWWPTAAIHGEATQELPNPAHFEQLAETITEEQVAEVISCGPDPELHVAKIREYIDAGYTHVYIHQVGPDQAGFLRFAERELLPALTPASAGAR